MGLGTGGTFHFQFGATGVVKYLYPFPFRKGKCFWQIQVVVFDRHAFVTIGDHVAVGVVTVTGGAASGFETVHPLPCLAGAGRARFRDLGQAVAGIGISQVVYLKGANHQAARPAMWQVFGLAQRRYGATTMVLFVASLRRGAR